MTDPLTFLIRVGGLTLTTMIAVLVIALALTLGAWP
jgi:hypothetical protein